MSTALVTGAGTPVGSELLELMVRRRAFDRLLVVGQPGPRWEAAGFSELGRRYGVELELLPGSPDRPRFGLPEARWSAAVDSADLGFNCAQGPLAGLPQEAARALNLAPVLGWLQVLDRNPRLALNHLSTAWVAGRWSGLFTEVDLEGSQGFRNSFERCQYEAEVCLQKSAARSRVRVFRPSLVVGRASDGRAHRFDGLYRLLGALRAGRPRLLAADPLAPLDLVPCDYVAEAMLALGRETPAAAPPAPAYHLVAGHGKTIAAGELVHRVAPGRGPLFLPPLATPMVHGPGLRTAAAYLAPSCVFDDFCARRSLGPLGLECPDPREYLPRLVAYAEALCWDDRAPRCAA